MSDDHRRLFEELQAFDDKWQLKYATVYDAALAAGIIDLYSLYLLSKARELDASPS